MMELLSACHLAMGSGVSAPDIYARIVEVREAIANPARHAECKWCGTGALIADGCPKEPPRMMMRQVGAE